METKNEKITTHHY